MRAIPAGSWERTPDSGAPPRRTLRRQHPPASNLVSGRFSLAGLQPMKGPSGGSCGVYLAAQAKPPHRSWRAGGLSMHDRR